jgi:hypothetical protein
MMGPAMTFSSTVISALMWEFLPSPGCHMNFWKFILEQLALVSGNHHRFTSKQSNHESEFLQNLFGLD